MTSSRLFVAAIAVTAALATPALAQWESRQPSAYEARYPDGERHLASPATRDTMAYAPSATSPRPSVIRATKDH